MACGDRLVFGGMHWCDCFSKLPRIYCTALLYTGSTGQLITQYMYLHGECSQLVLLSNATSAVAIGTQIRLRRQYLGGAIRARRNAVPDDTSRPVSAVCARKLMRLSLRYMGKTVPSCAG